MYSDVIFCVIICAIVGALMLWGLSLEDKKGDNNNKNTPDNNKSTPDNNKNTSDNNKDFINPENKSSDFETPYDDPNFWKQLYTKALKIYTEDYLQKIPYKIININDTESIVSINDDELLVYIGVVVVFDSQYNFTSRWIQIEELTFNNLYEINKTKLKNQLNHDARIINFQGLDLYGGILNSTEWCQFKRINELLPDLQLIKRYNENPGIIYTFIIFEVYDEDGSSYALKYTTKTNINEIAFEACEMLDKGIDPKLIGLEKIVNKFEKIDKEYLYKYNGEIIASLQDHLRYFFVKQGVKELLSIQQTALEILHKAELGNYSNLPRIQYEKPDYKWKSENLVYKYCTEIFGEANVIHQYRPYFLKTTKGGQMSYDIYLTEYNVAIEYQGQQHFKPVDYFGGQNKYADQVMRDNLKKELSEKNGVILIYIDYNEDISKDLIIKKMIDAGVIC